MQVPWLSPAMANPHDEKMNSAQESTKVLIEAPKKDIEPRDIVTKKSLENWHLMAAGGAAYLVSKAIKHAQVVGFAEWENALPPASSKALG